MDCGHDDGGVRGFAEGVLEEAHVCASKYAYVVGVQLYVNNLLMAGACNGDCGGEPYFDGCVDVSQHRICLGVSQGDNEAS